MIFVSRNEDIQVDHPHKVLVKKWHLENSSERGDKWVIPIEPVPFTIGRNNGCNLKLHSSSVSRNHAQIYISGNIIWIRDLGSTNGTYLNRNRITEAETLKSGDILQFGNVVFSLKSTGSIRKSEGDETDTMLLNSSDGRPKMQDSYDHELKKMLKDRTVAPHFQPIISLSDNRIMGYEILGRLPEYSTLPSNPEDFFNIAVSVGLESELSSLFREEGINQGIKIEGSPILFVNTHPIELYRISDLEDSLRKIRKISNSNAIVLEISEKAITDLKKMKSLKSTLEKLNIGLAYDDFGVGNTRLIELARFPPDFLKFDISIIRNIHVAPKRLHQMIETFLNMSRDMGITTISEGIECSEEGEACKTLGFDCAQGDFYGVPVKIF